jgi:hypothetical protein
MAPAIVRVTFFLTMIGVICSASVAGNIPQQIHLSFGSQLHQMMVTWVTLRPTAHAHVLYGAVGKRLNQLALANSTMYENPGNEGRLTYMHRALLTGLKASTRYTYQVMSGRTAATPMFFTSRSTPPTIRVNSSKPIVPATFAMFADMGVNTTLLNKLAAQAARGDFQAVLHGGDIAYDLHKKNGRLGDTFMRQIQPIAGHVAYQVAPGNHERKHNFSQYDARFSMIDQQSAERRNHYYSFDEHLVHFVFYSTEFYFYPEFGVGQLEAQYNWLAEDLKRANSPVNRSKRPWIIAVAHRSMYCAGFDRKDCDRDQRVFRAHTKFPIEKLFQAHGVDMHLSGHEHAYVRMLPVYGRRVFSDSVNNRFESNRSVIDQLEAVRKFALNESSIVNDGQTGQTDGAVSIDDDDADDNEYDVEDNHTDQLGELRRFYSLEREARVDQPAVAVYHDPPVIVNVISGAASNMPNDHAPPTEAPRWVAKWSLEASYTRFTVHNASYLHVQQVTGAPEGQDLLDEMHLYKTVHGPIMGDFMNDLADDFEFE